MHCGTEERRRKKFSVVAKWTVAKNKKTCKKCKQLLNADSFSKGIRQVLKPSFFKEQNCAKCEVTLRQPIPENENIIDIYNAIPLRYDPYSGDRIITAQDIQFMLNFYDVPKILHFDYFHRVVFLHSAILNADRKQGKLEQERKEEQALWTKEKLNAMGISNKSMK